LVSNTGAMWAYGAGWNGALGNGTTTSASTLNEDGTHRIGSLLNWKNVYGGNTMFLAIKTDGTLWAWGSNGYGELGQGDTTNRSSPVQIGSATNWRTCAITEQYGFNGCAAINTSGQLYTWGRGESYGHLGQGNTTNYSTPVQVGNLTNWLHVCGSNGSYRSFHFIKTDGTRWTTASIPVAR